MICTFYRGRLDILHAMNLPIGDINFYYNAIIEESKTDEGKKRAEGEALEDELIP